jgi:hypothetical protein
VREFILLTWRHNDNRTVNPPNPIAIEPAAISASPAVMMSLDASTAPDKPAANANGTIGHADYDITNGF